MTQQEIVELYRKGAGTKAELQAVVEECKTFSKLLTPQQQVLFNDIEMSFLSCIRYLSETNIKLVEELIING